jgi:hypothetical protein
MALMSGNDGDLTFASTSLPCRTWTLSKEAGEIETTNSTDAATTRSFLAGRQGASFSAEVYADDATAEATVGETAIAAEFIAKQGTADKKWAASIMLTSAEIVCNIPEGDAVLIRYGGRITGAITPTQYSA